MSVHPLGGNITANIENAKRYSQYVFKCGMAPVIPHFYALVLNDDNPEERKLGMQAGISLLWVCDEVWGFRQSNYRWYEKGNPFCRKAEYQSQVYIGKRITKDGGYLNEN